MFLVCGARYKTRQGLSYHLSHTHRGDNNKQSSSSANIVVNDSLSSNSSSYILNDQQGTSGSHKNLDQMPGLTDYSENYLGYMSTSNTDNTSGYTL